MRRKCIHREPAYLWSTRVKRVGIMPILSYALPPRATQFSGIPVSASPAAIRRRLLLLDRLLGQVRDNLHDDSGRPLLKLPWPGHRKEILPEERPQHQPAQHSKRHDRKRKG